MTISNSSPPLMSNCSSSADEAIPLCIVNDDPSQISSPLIPLLLHSAIRNNATKIIEYLLVNNLIKDNQEVDSNNTSALMLAVQYQQFHLINHLTSTISLQDNSGTTALMRAVEFDFQDVFTPLLAEISIQDNAGITALMISAMNGNASWFPKLIQEVDILDNDQMSVFQICKMRGTEDLVKQLQNLQEK